MPTNTTRKKKRTDKITKQLLGKITQESGFLPSEKYLLKEKTVQILPTECRPTNPGAEACRPIDIKTYGVFRLFKTFLSEELESLQSLFSADISQALLTIAMMRFAHQCPLKRIPTLHAHDFCSGEWAVNGLNDKKITAVLKLVGENRTMLVEWMKSRLGISQANTSNFVMIDSTHSPTLSENLHVNARGYNPQQSYDTLYFFR